MLHTEALWFQPQGQSQHGPGVPAPTPGRPASLPTMDSLSPPLDRVPWV